jgi:aspartate/glutamate racemase
MINGSPAVFIVHTSDVSVADLNGLFGELAPDAVVRNIVDDSLLPEVLANGGVTDGVTSRLTEYYLAAEAAGADLVFNQCSSVGQVADDAASKLGVPLVRVDRAMAQQAVATGDRIGVIATLGTTLKPTCALVRGTAAEAGKAIEIEEHLVEGAFDLLRAGDRAGHNRAVIDGIKDLAQRVDVVVCAQGSMAALLDELGDGEVAVPVLTSPRAGVEQAVEVLSRSRAAA